VTDRKPPGVSWESWTEKQIEEGRRAGLFDGLQGHGKPIDGLDGAHDEEWWIKAKLRREEIDYLPPTLAIRGERDTAVTAALAAADEGKVREILEQVNDRIRYVNSHTVAGPPSTVWVVDIEAILERWRAARPMAPHAEGDTDNDLGTGTAAGEPDGGRAPRRRRWIARRRATP
jgi:hypothetical protein